MPGASRAQDLHATPRLFCGRFRLPLPRQLHAEPLGTSSCTLPVGGESGIFSDFWDLVNLKRVLPTGDTQEVQVGELGSSLLLRPPVVLGTFILQATDVCAVPQVGLDRI